jgi:methionyl-tRNA formyltransferase
LKIFVCAYREWGLEVYTSLLGLFPEHDISLAKTPQELTTAVENLGIPEVVLCVGWSWKVDPSLTDACWVVGVHPSDLPEFKGGSPIQNQIQNGVTETKNTLFRLTAKLDAGPILAKLPLDLSGHMKDIFRRLAVTSVVLFADFIRQFPNVVIPPAIKGEGNEKLHKCLSPHSSEITREDFSKKSAQELYDLIRCHEDPYPNCFLEDSTGRLIFKLCEFSSSK